jgi:hypothetical protein
MLPEAIEMLGLAGLPVTAQMQNDWWKVTKGKPLTIEGQKRVAMAYAARNPKPKPLTFWKPFPQPTRGMYYTPTAEGWRQLAHHWQTYSYPSGMKHLPIELHEFAEMQIRAGLEQICKGYENTLDEKVLATICLHEADLCEK